MIRSRGSRPACSPRAVGVVRTRIRCRGARRDAPRLRRSSRAALPALARRHARSGAVGVEPGLVGGLSGAPVLPARRRLRGSAPAPGVLHGALGAGVVPRARLDRLPGAGPDRVPGARANSRKRLARPARRPPRPHRLRPGGARRGGGRAPRAGGGARLPGRPGAGRGVGAGVHIGMVGARLAWALVPLLLLALVPWLEEERRISRSAVLVTAAIVLLHPAMLPAAVVLILVGAIARPTRARRLATGLAALALAAALTAFWTWPLLLRLANARALAWGEPPLPPAPPSPVRVD